MTGSRMARKEFALYSGEQCNPANLIRSGVVKKSNLLMTIVIFGVLIAGAVFLYRNHYPVLWGGYGGSHMGRGMAGHWGMGLMMPLFWVLLIAVVVSLFNRTTRQSRELTSPLSDGPDAVELLKQRYAKGEIDKTEFRSKMDDIRNVS
jgi:putative membrane protein